MAFLSKLWRSRENPGREKKGPNTWKRNGEDDRRIAGQPIKFTRQELQIATDNFRDKNVIRWGSFGKVYKGALNDDTKIAVKRLNDYAGPNGEAAFLREVELRGFAVHRNILRLIGFCITPTEKLLVYPFMQNLSVGERLRDLKPTESVLDWSTRKRVALGTARGLEYLHEHINPKIIHRHVKASNVLLDEDFEAVVGDFGLAMVDGKETAEVVCGTIGYIAPEFLHTGIASERTDVYAYGITLLELVTGKRAFDFTREVSIAYNMSVFEHVLKLIQEKQLDSIIDRNLNKNYNVGEVEKMIQIALLCTHVTPEDRPRMSDVVRMFKVEEGLTKRWKEWLQFEATRRQKNERLLRRFDSSGDSFNNMESIELSGGR